MKITQEQKVYRHLKHFGSITPMEAIRQYGITRLAAVVFNLKESGVPIATVRRTGKNRFGEKTNWAEYSIEEAHT